MPALPPYVIAPIWQQFSALLPERDLARGTPNEFASFTFLVPVPPCYVPRRCGSVLPKRYGTLT
jgi:hypothetical protein